MMIADTRTNAGLDNVSTFRKLHIFSKPGDRIMAIASAGNLAVSQSVLSTLTEGLEDPNTGEIETLMNAPTMFQAAQRIGRAIRAVHATEGPALKSEDVSFDVSFLFGGQISGARMRLFMVYTAGNFIECTTDTPYLQIGEHKYGKPVLDRANALRRRALRGAEDRADLDGLDHALESRRRPADRCAGGARRRLRGRSQPPHRGGRALFPRFALALVSGLACRASEHSAAALQERKRIQNLTA
ncbi:putative proteasome-type protease [Bradyrhizobium sp. F1.13.4]